MPGRCLCSPRKAEEEGKNKCADIKIMSLQLAYHHRALLHNTRVDQDCKVVSNGEKSAKLIKKKVSHLDNSRVYHLRFCLSVRGVPIQALIILKERERFENLSKKIKIILKWSKYEP